MRVAAVMPCRGRTEQTVRNVQRLLATAGAVDWRLTLVVDGDPDLFQTLLQHDLAADVICSVEWGMRPPTQRVGYWESLRAGSEWLNNADAPLLVNLANDLLPGQHWLQRAVAAYDATFPAPTYGLMGFNDGHHETEHSCHFLIDRDLLTYLGGWPVWYGHNYGDTELCQRAIELGVYAKAPYATLFHDHPYFGGDDDAVYAEGRRTVDQDHATYERRKANGWRS